ncbi:MAG: hypothetical protein AAFQ94_15650 [Bacteroidota bacterium]
MKHRFLKFIRRVIVLVLVLTIVVFISNEIVYRNSIPESFAASNWYGHWNSSDYVLVSGKILTMLPENDNAQFKSEALVYYNIWSMYKPGQNKLVTLSGGFSESTVNGNNLEQKMKTSQSDQYDLKFFKAKISIGKGQYIEYSGMKDHEGIAIEGQYDASFPKDKGTFELKKL